MIIFTWISFGSILKTFAILHTQKKSFFSDIELKFSVTLQLELQMQASWTYLLGSQAIWFQTFHLNLKLFSDLLKWDATI
jgi:hypothetical protein